MIKYVRYTAVLILITLRYRTFSFRNNGILINVVKYKRKLRNIL